MTRNDIHSFVEARLLNGKQVAADDNLLLTGLVDSLGVMTLVGHLETETGRVIPLEDVTLENFATIDAIATYLDAA